MTFSVRSCLTTGVAAVTAVTMAATGSISEPTRHPTSAPVRVVQQPVQLAAAVQQTAATSATALPNLLTDLFRDLVPSASAAFPAPQFPPVVVGNSLSSGIKNIYKAVEPWVQWGFEVAAYAVGWVPWVGYLAPQITIFYNLGERIVRSVTFNIADWIGGSVSFFQGLRNVAVDTINSFIHFANDELAFWLPPLPPMPPIGGGLFTATAVQSKLAGATATDADPTTAGTITEVPAETLGHEETTPGPEKTPAIEPQPTPATDLSAPITEPETVQPEPGAPLAELEEMTIDLPEAQPEVEVETPVPDLALKEEEKADPKPDPKPETKPDTKPDNKPDNKPESGPDA
ncbi:MAG: hypothetical protein WBO08_14420 [Mycobacterium sp.]|nr:hypothetical protein [Mycobacterium sp.]